MIFTQLLNLNLEKRSSLKWIASEEEDRTMLILSHPINIIEVKGRKGDPLGYKIDPWLKTTTDDMFIINMDDVLTLF